jgi:hypothetical protein
MELRVEYYGLNLCVEVINGQSDPDVLLQGLITWGSRRTRSIEQWLHMVPPLVTALHKRLFPDWSMSEVKDNR